LAEVDGNHVQPIAPVERLKHPAPLHRHRHAVSHPLLLERQREHILLGPRKIARLYQVQDTHAAEHDSATREKRKPLLCQAGPAHPEELDAAATSVYSTTRSINACRCD